MTSQINPADAGSPTENNGNETIVIGPYGVLVRVYTGTTCGPMPLSMSRNGDGSVTFSVGLHADHPLVVEGDTDATAKNVLAATLEALGRVPQSLPAPAPAEIICAYCEEPILPGADGDEAEALPVLEDSATAPDLPLHKGCRDLWQASTRSPLELWRELRGGGL